MYRNEWFGLDIFKDRIKPLIDVSGKPDFELEKEIGLPRSAINKWKSGITKSYRSYLPQIADYFNVSIDYLLGKTDIKNKPTGKADELTEEIFRLAEDLPHSEILKMIEYAKFLKASLNNPQNK